MRKLKFLTTVIIYFTISAFFSDYYQAKIVQAVVLTLFAAFCVIAVGFVCIDMAFRPELEKKLLSIEDMSDPTAKNMINVLLTVILYGCAVSQILSVVLAFFGLGVLLIPKPIIFYASPNGEAWAVEEQGEVVSCQIVSEHDKEVKVLQYNKIQRKIGDSMPDTMPIDLLELLHYPFCAARLEEFRMDIEESTRSPYRDSNPPFSSAETSPSTGESFDGKKGPTDKKSANGESDEGPSDDDILKKTITLQKDKGLLKRTITEMSGFSTESEYFTPGAHRKPLVGFGDAV